MTNKAIVNRLVKRFGKAADDEENDAVIVALSLFMVEVIIESDMDSKMRFVDDLATAMKKYIQVYDAGKSDQAGGQKAPH